jgi:TonB family protein
MPKKSIKPKLFDRSGNLLPDVMKLYLEDKLGKDEKDLVEKHMVESDFDREAMEGLQTNISGSFEKEISDLQEAILISARKRRDAPATGRSEKLFWYAAAGIAILIGLSVLLVFMLREPEAIQQIAVIQPDTISNTTMGTFSPSEDKQVGVKGNTPATKEVTGKGRREILEEGAASVKEGDIPYENNTLPEQIHDSLFQPVMPEPEIAVVNYAEPARDQIVGGISINEPDKITDFKYGKNDRNLTASRSQAKIAASETLYQATDSKPDTNIFISVEVMPEFPGGDSALQQFINDSLRYPAMARSVDTEKKVYLAFVINVDGSITNIQIRRGIGGGYDEEAIRLVRSMPNWLPGLQRGIPVRVLYWFELTFGPKPGVFDPDQNHQQYH